MDSRCFFAFIIILTFVLLNAEFIYPIVSTPGSERILNAKVTGILRFTVIRIPVFLIAIPVFQAENEKDSKSMVTLNPLK